MKLLLGFLFSLFINSALLFSAEAPFPFANNICSVMTPLSLKLNVGSLGSCYRCNSLWCYPAHLHTFFVPEAFVSVFDAPINSQFNTFPVGIGQIVKEDWVKSMVLTQFGRPKPAVTPPQVVLSKRSYKGQNRFKLNAHVGPVFWAQEYFLQMYKYFWSKVFPVPVHGVDGKCIQYSTVMDAEQWGFGTLDRTPANQAFNIIAGSLVGGAIGMAKAKEISGFMCDGLKTTGRISSCQGKPMLNPLAIAATLALTNPITACKVFGFSLLEGISVPKLALPSQLEPSFLAMFKNQIAFGGPMCKPNVNLYPLISASDYCYDRRIIFPRTAHVRASGWFEAAYITAIKSLSMASETALYVPATPGSFICDERGLNCFPYGTPAAITTKVPGFRDMKNIMTTNRINYVLWTPRAVCGYVRVDQATFVSDLSAFCSTMPKLIELEYKKQIKGMY